MKKIRPGFIILLVIISLAVGATGYVVFRIARASAAFQPPDVSLEGQLSSFSDRLGKKLLEQLGYPVKTYVFRYNRDLYQTVIRRYNEDDDWDGWKAWLETGGTLVLLVDSSQRTKTTMAVVADHPLLDDVTTLFIDPALTLEDFSFPFDNTDRVWVLSAHSHPLIMSDRVGEGRVVYIADATVFNDDGVINASNGYLLNNCVKDHYPATVVFDEQGSSTQPIFRDDGESTDAEPTFILFRGHFLPVFLHMLFLGILFCLIYWKRFGPARDLEQFSKRTLLHHLTATGNFFEKTKNPRVIADILDRSFFSRLRDLLHSRSGTPADLSAAVGRRLDMSPQDKDAFSSDLGKNLVARDDRRERIILRLKGVEHYHGKNKITG